MKCLISKMAVVRTIVCCLIIGGSPAVAMAQFDYPVGQPDGAGWLGNRNGLWWLDQYDYGGGCLAYHPGIDLNKEGTAGDADRYEPVYAAAAGTVVAAARYGSTWGNIVVIEHTLGDGSRVWSLYGHLEDFTVAVNDDVSRRAQIGRVGKGDGSLAAHLHFEIRRISQPASAFPCNQTMSWVQDRYYDPVAFVSSHRAGTDRVLVKTASSPDVYWLQNNRRYPVYPDTALTTMQNAGIAGWNWSLISVVPSLSGVEGPLFIGTNADSNGLLVQQTSDANSVYVVQNGRRRLFSSEAALNWNGAHWGADIIRVAPAIFSLYTNGTGQPLYEIGQGEADAAIKQQLKAAYASLQGLPVCGSSSWDGWPGQFATCLEFPQSEVLTGFNSSVSGRTGKYQNFGNDTTRLGSLQYVNGLGTFGVWGGIYLEWQRLNYAAGPLGFPTSHEYQWGSYRRSDFEGGYIYWSSGTGAVAVYMPAPTRIIALTGDLAFGSVQVGTTTTRTLTIRNTGNSPLTVSGLTYPAGFSGNWSSGTVSAGGSQAVTVAFAPTAVTGYGGTVSVSADPTSGTATIRASGMGTAAPTRIIALTGDLAFGSVQAGTTATRTLTIKNTGSSPLTVSGLAYPAGFSGNWSSGTVPAGGSQAVMVTFAPTAVTGYGGTVSVSADQTSGISTIRASGAGTQARPRTDVDGDGRADLTVFRPSTGEWFVRKSTSGFGYADFLALQWGLPGDTPLAADFDGDSRLDLTVFRPSTGEWFVRYSSRGYSYAFDTYQWGLRADIPLVADFDGDGRSDLVVYRPSTGEWFVRYSTRGYSYLFDTYQWGLPGDAPLAADFDGDGRTDLAVFRPTTGDWFVRYSSRGYSYLFDTFGWGLPGDHPLATDFDGDRKTDLVVFRPGNGTWYVRMSSSAYSYATWTAYQWGLPGDVPLAADFDGDARTDLVVYRPLTGEWFVRHSSAGYGYIGFGIYQWGLPGDLPLIPGKR